jgi:hypothetical protein
MIDGEADGVEAWHSGNDLRGRRHTCGSTVIHLADG